MTEMTGLLVKPTLYNLIQVNNNKFVLYKFGDITQPFGLKKILYIRDALQKCRKA